MPVQAKNRLDMQIINLIDGYYFLVFVLIEDPLDIEYFEDGAIGAYCEQVATV